MLQDVIISENRFTALPEVLYSIASLETILAGNNQITAINVDGFMKMKSLTCLDLHNNDIQQVPPQIGRMEWLRLVDLSYNIGSMLHVILKHGFKYTSVLTCTCKSYTSTSQSSKDFLGYSA